MVIGVPFVKWQFQRHHSHGNRRVGFFYLIGASGQRVRAAGVISRSNGQAFYHACIPFHNHYTQELELGDRVSWHSNQDFVLWLEACMHNSFVRYSTPGVFRCWHRKYIGLANMHGPVALPPGLAADMQGVGANIWILFRNGEKGWPIRVVNNNLQNGWIAFRRAHKLKPGYTLVLSCEKKWVFNVVILDGHDKQVSYNWASEINPHFADVPLDNLPTAFQPSLAQHVHHLSNTGFMWLPIPHYRLKFEYAAREILRMPEIPAIVIVMGARMWHVPIVACQYGHRHLDPTICAGFIDDLQLHVRDYVLLSLMDAHQLRVVVFDGDTKAERLYGWL